MTGWQVFAIPVDQALLVALSVGVAALIRAFTGFGFAMLAVPVFSLLLLPGDAVVLSAVLALILGLMSYRSWWGLFPVTPALPMVSGSVLGTGVGVWFLASLSVTEFQLWIGISSRGGVFGVVAFYTPRESRLWVHLTGYRCGLGINERRFCHPRAAGHFVCGRHHGESGALTGVSDDVLLVLQYCVARHVWHRGADYPQTIPVALGGAASHVVGESARQLGLRAILPGPPTGRL